MIAIRKLDRYVAGTFLGPFALCAAAFVGLYVVVDFSSNIDDFFRQKSLWDSLGLAVQYYVLSIPPRLSQALPMLTAVAAVVCVVRLHRGNEICAMRSCGISGRRIAVPVLACGGGIVLLAFFNQELLVPSVREPLLAIERRIGLRKPRSVGLSYLVDRSGRHLLVGAFDAAASLPALTDVRIRWEDASGTLHKLLAARAFAPARGATWYLEDARACEVPPDAAGGPWRELDPGGEADERLLRFTSRVVARRIESARKAPNPADIPLVVTDPGPPRVRYEFGGYTESDQHWPVARFIDIIDPARPDTLIRIQMMVWTDGHWRVFGGWRFGRTDPETGRRMEDPIEDGGVLATSIRPSEIQAREFKRASMMMTLAELADRGARFPSRRFRKRCWVIIWNRLAFPFGNVILLLMAVSFTFRQGAHSTLTGISLAALMTFLYLAANSISIDLAYRQFFAWAWPPFAGTFPTVLFAAVGVGLFVRMNEI